MHNPVKPDRHAQNKKPIWSKEWIDGSVAEERSEDRGRAAAAISVLINAHFWFPFRYLPENLFFVFVYSLRIRCQHMPGGREAATGCVYFVAFTR